MKLGAGDLATALRNVAIQIEQMADSLRDISTQVEALPSGTGTGGTDQGAVTAPLPIINVAKATPYRLQWDVDGNQFTSDCGPACLAMVLQYFSVWVDINQLAREAGMVVGRPFTVPGDLIRAASLHGVTLDRRYPLTVRKLELEIEAGRPVICLIHYGSLGKLRQDQSYNHGHWVVVVGVDDNVVTLHDPDWQVPSRDKGNALLVERATFEQAWELCSLDGNTPNQCLMVVPRAV